MKKSDVNVVETSGLKLNNYFMKGIDGINQQERVAIWRSEQDTSVHMHDFIEIVYFIKGVGTHYVDGKMYRVCQGSVCVMNDKIKHHYYVDRTYCDTLSVKNIIFHREFLDCYTGDFIEEFAQKHHINLPKGERVTFYHLLNDQDKEIEKCMSLIEGEMQAKRDNYLQVVKSLIETIIIILISERGGQIAGKRYNKNHERIEESIEFLNEHISNVPPMKEVAKMYGFSAEYYSKLFREFTGKSFVEFVQEMKCNEAARLLMETDYTNERIAELSGFVTQKYFYQQFKKCKGITPREYVKRNI